MFAHVTSLRYWKSERADITTCEDALHANVRRGLFCVADGAGTTLFSNIWAEILVEQFAHEPLLSSDPFEMEWWIRQAQKYYRERVPLADKLGWNARRKAVEQGAYATLATMRFTHSEAQSATAQLLAVGDSCVIIGRPAHRQITPFPLQHAEDFNRAPYCVPSLLKNLNRYMLYTRTDEVTLMTGDIVILATDAVARWIISGKGTDNEQLIWEAFLEVAQKTESDWPTFINACRATQMMVDDDATAIIITLQEMGSEEERLDTQAGPSAETVTQRTEEFKRVHAENNKELVAIVYGDGHMLNDVGISLSDEDKKKARAVADALRNVLQTMRDEANHPKFVAKIEPVWWQYADLLMDEPCAETIRRNLTAQGVRLRKPLNSSAMQQTVPSSLSGKWSSTSTPAPLKQPYQETEQARPSPSFRTPVDSEPENAIVFTPSVVPIQLYAPDQQQKALQTLREALQAGDPHKVRMVYDPALEGGLTSNEVERLKAIWQQLRTEMINLLRDAFDQNDDEAILATAEAIESAQLEDILKEYERRQIQDARDRQAAFEHLLNVLEVGTAQQKATAWQPFSQHPRELAEPDKKQLMLAKNLVSALASGKVDDICNAYDAIELSPLQQHFLFTEEELGRIRYAQKEQVAIEWFRKVLESGVTLAQVVTLFKQLHAPYADLSQDEVYCFDWAESFLQLSKSMQQAQPQKNKDLAQVVYFYDMLYYSPYRFSFSESEKALVRRSRDLTSPSAAIVMMVNSVPVSIEQFNSLYRVKPVYARYLIAAFQHRLVANPPEAERQRLTSKIAFWQQAIEPRWLPETILNDLIHQILLEQQIREEVASGNTRRNKVNLEKEAHNRAEELAKEVYASADENVRAARDFPTEKELRDILTPYVLYDILDRYLKEASPGQFMEDRLRERKNMASILYCERPGMHATTTTEQQRCWLFKWWFIRRLYNVPTSHGGA